MELQDLTDLQKKYYLHVEVQKSEQEKKKSEIIKEYGDHHEFIKSLTYHIIDRSGDVNFPAFYNVYDKIFTIKEEKESYEGFEEVLDFNFDQTLQKKFNPFKEVLLYCRAPNNDEVIGGINFSTYYIPDLVDNYKILGTSHLFYIFVKPEYRFLRLGIELLEKAKKYSESLLSRWAGINDSEIKLNKNQLIVFCEQNYPEKMTPVQYWLDNLNSLTDQCDRLIWWNNRGFRRLKFDYVQPSLNPQNEPCTYLSLNAQVDKAENLPSSIILEHIRRIFGISVLKGRDIENDINYKQIENYLRNNPLMYFEDSIDFFHLKKLIYDSSNLGRSSSTLIGNLIENRKKNILY